MSTESGDRPNIVWVCTEHQRYDTIRAMGNDHIRTPNIDRLVENGVAFSRAYSQNAVCAPSRSTFLTGRYPAATGCRQNGQNIPEDEVLITRELADIGYDCGLAGKLHISAAASGSERRIDDGYREFHWSHGSTKKHGGEWVQWLRENGKTFDEIYTPSDVIYAREITDRRYHQTTWCFQKAMEFIRQERDCPWLVSINPFAAHDPFDYLPEFYERYDIDDMPPSAYIDGELENKPWAQKAAYENRGPSEGGYEATTERQRKQMKAAYYATIEHIDAEFGRLMDMLQKSGEAENTLIIFHADHGDMGGDHGIFQKGAYLYEPAVCVPLILSWPRRLPTGMRSNALAELADLVPTIYQLLGLDIPEGVQGKSLLPVMEGRIGADEHRSAAYSEFFNANPAWTVPHEERTYMSMLREDRYKVIVTHGEKLGELYDLQQDPGEHENLWDDPEYRDIRFEMVKRCFDRRALMADPLPPRSANF